MNIQNAKIGSIGRGYVALPLAEIGKKRPALGFDESRQIAELQSGHDSMLEVSAAELEDAGHLEFSNSAEDLKICQIIIVTVPTPVDSAKRPYIAPLIRAGKTTGRVLFKNAVVIFESTVNREPQTKSACRC